MLSIRSCLQQAGITGEKQGVAPVHLSSSQFELSDDSGWILEVARPALVGLPFAPGGLGLGKERTLKNKRGTRSGLIWALCPAI